VFATNFKKQLPSRFSIVSWLSQGILFTVIHVKVNQPSVPENIVYMVNQTFAHSPQKSTHAVTRAHQKVLRPGQCLQPFLIRRVEWMEATIFPKIRSTFGKHVLSSLKYTHSLLLSIVTNKNQSVLVALNFSDQISS
jgi:hypothetical protein